MVKKIFTSNDYQYDIEHWNPIVETQEEQNSITVEKLSPTEEGYILSHKKIWDKLSKY